MTILVDWIFVGNARPLLISLGWFAGYAFDEDDWLAVRHGLEGTDQEADRWFDYDLAGEQPVALQLAIDPGTQVVHVRVRCPQAIVPKAEAAISIFQHFRIQADNR